MSINRKLILDRNNPKYSNINKNAPLSAGNGRFCFTADFTGLQTFFDEYAKAQDAFPLCTMAEWGWHSYPMSENDEAALRFTPFDTYGRQVCYATDSSGQEELFKRIRVNAHKFHLGKIGFELNERKISIDDCKPVIQILSLWEGILTSEFEIENKIVKTEIFISPDEDALFARISSPLLKDGKLRVTIEFPYGSHKKSGADFSVPDLHITRKASWAGEQGAGSGEQTVVNLERTLDDTKYIVIVSGSGFSAEIDEKQHKLHITPQAETIELKILFSPVTVPSFSSSDIACYAPLKNRTNSFDSEKIKCKNYWENYWNSGGFIDFKGSKDSRAAELERRIVLSQYLIAVQSRGKIPPAETGLTCNSWYGKFHLEMHFWHHAHFAYWGRIDEVKKALEYYKKILPAAKEIAKSQEYSGARWPKMCDPSGKNTPSSIAVLLLWQQPHPIMFAELVRRAFCENNRDGKKSAEILREYREIITETAEFMKSFLHWEPSTAGGGRYLLGPPYIPAQERHDPKIVLNAAYELEYFRWGFKTADEWLCRLGEKKRYGEIIEKLSLPAEKDGLYLAHENCPDTFSKLPFYTDHPSMTAMYGILNSEKIDPKKMSATLDKILEVWDKKTFYGWDLPMLAMTACRLGRYSDAVDLLLMDSPKNTYLENGHNKMTGDDALPLYLPGNGGLLLAIAMMAAGFEGKKGPLFPDGFTINTEGITPYI